MANEAILSAGTTLNLETSGGAISDAGFAEADNDTRATADNPGYPMGEFVFISAGTFSAAPTAGAVINLYEQKTDGTTDSPDVDASNRNDYIGSFIPDLADVSQTLRLIAPIYREGGKYWIEWVDGGAGTASITAGWTLDLTPITYGTAA